MSTQIAVILTDAEKQILWVNKDFTELTGYLAEEAIGKKPGDLLQGKDSEIEVISSMRNKINNKEPCKERISNYRKDGRVYVCSLSIHPVFSNSRLTNYLSYELDCGEITQEDERLMPIMYPKKYIADQIKNLQEIVLYAQLNKLMIHKRLYQDSNLTLPMVARELGITSKNLSRIINRQSGVNFQKFINHFRIEEVKQRLLDEQYSYLTLYGIAVLSGFKNKSTFYKVFKEFMMMTPRQFVQIGKEKSSHS